jgi:hypothetical protein
MGNVFRLHRIRKLAFFIGTTWSILGITVVLLLLTEAGFRAAFALRDLCARIERPDRRVLIEGYAGATWPVQHYRELDLIEDRWHPYVYFRQKAFRGETITVDQDGLRATWQPPTPTTDDSGRPPLKLLMLGGSSLWGFGARDDQTIPSLVARMLHERSRRVEVKNLAEIGYVSTQEVIALLRELQAGYRPDLVIFYDGVNDTTAALLEGTAGLSTNEVNRRTEFNLLQSPNRLARALAAKLVKDSASYRFAQAVRHRLVGLPDSSQPPPKATLRPLCDEIVDRYEANIVLVESLGRAFDFRPLFYWQPDIFTKPALASVEREEAARFGWAERTFRDVHARISASSALRSHPSFHDQSAAFGDTPGLVFIDYCHTTETANLRIATVMVEDIIEAVRRVPLSGSRHGSTTGEPSHGTPR